MCAQKNGSFEHTQEIFKLKDQKIIHIFNSHFFIRAMVVVWSS